MTPASETIASNPVLRPRSNLCRSLTLGGRMCRATAMRGHDLCVRHAEHRFPVLKTGPGVTIPLLEDLESVQIFASQVMQGIAANSIDIHRGGKLLYGCQIIANTMPRPARLRPSKEQEKPSEPVSEVFLGPDGHLLGPIEDARKTARFEGYWSFEKFMYEEECKRLGRPLPQTPADLPESGWLTPQDLENLQRQRDAGEVLLNDGYRDKMLQLHLEADRLGKLPPIAERRCVYASDTQCAGPAPHGPCYSPCDYCERERDEYLRLHPDEDPLPVTGLKACAEDPCTPHVKSVNTVKLRRCNQLRRQPAQGGHPRSHLRVTRPPRLRGTTSVILPGLDGNAMLHPRDASWSPGNRLSSRQLSSSSTLTGRARQRRRLPY